jgi:WD40 repeat protein
MILAVRRIVLLALVALVPATPSPGAGSGEAPIAFVSTRDGVPAVYVVRSDGSEFRRLIADATGPKWSPDGTKIAFERRDGLYVLTLATRRVSRVSAGVIVLGGYDWSPDSSRLVYGPAGYGIWVVDADGAHRRRLTSEDDIVPRWSPDAKLIAFERTLADNSYALFVMGYDGRGAHRLGNSTVWSDLYAWSPDATEIAFVFVDEFVENPHLALTRVDVGGTRVIAPVGDSPGGVAWAPDGQSLAIGSNDNLLVVAAHDGPSQSRVLSRRGTSGPSWSPDGKRIVAAREDDLWVFPVDGSKPGRITNAKRYDYGNDAPAWAPQEPEHLGGTILPQRLTSDSQVHGNVLWTRGVIDLIAADGPRVAIAYASRPRCIELWDTAARRLIRYAEDACASEQLGAEAQAITGLALGGTRLAWVVTMETNHSNTWVATATEDSPHIVSAYGGVTDGENIGPLVGGRGTIVFQSNRPLRHRLLRLDRTRTTTILPVHGTELLATAGDLVVRRAGENSIQVLGRNGRTLRTIRVGAAVAAAATDGTAVATLASRTLDVWTPRTGARVFHRVVYAGTRLLSYNRGYAALAGNGGITIVHVADGSTKFVRVPSAHIKAALTSAGLFYEHPGRGAFADRVTFVPLHELVSGLR